MRHILSKNHRGVLKEFASSRVLLGFDFDGTLAPIVSEPQAGHMRANTRKLLRVVAERYPCAVISGRARSDVLARLTGIPVIEVVGNHGFEPTRDLKRWTAVVRRWAAILHARLDAVPGVIIEDKGLSLAVHYRKSRRKRHARRAIVDASMALDRDVRIIAGKLAVNVLPDGASHKGIALRRLRARVADTAVFIGDDVTDEDVFELDEPGRLLSIRVGYNAASAALYYLRGQSEVDDLLEVFARLRARPT